MQFLRHLLLIFLNRFDSDAQTMMYGTNSHNHEQDTSVSIYTWRILLVATAVLGVVCLLVFISCFETWAVDSPTGFWNWHS